MMATVTCGRELFEEVACPACGGNRYTVSIPSRIPDDLTAEEVRHYFCSSSDHGFLEQLVCCDDCSLAYLNPRIRAELIISGYSEAVDPVFARQNEFRIRTFKRSLRQVMSATGLSPARGRRVLDVGCAGGAFVKAAVDLGFEAIGVEPSRWLCDFGRQLYGLDLRPGVLGDQDFLPRSFDLITLWDVIEHLTDPGEVTEQVHDLLAERGLFVVNYPDYGSLACRLLGRKWPFFLSVHLIYFTRETIRRFLEDRGFEVLQIQPFWQTLEFGYALDRAAALLPFVSPVARLANAMRLGRLPFIYNMGQSTVIARKRAQ